MAINGVGHNYDYLGTTTNYNTGKSNCQGSNLKDGEAVGKSFYF